MGKHRFLAFVLSFLFLAPFFAYADGASTLYDSNTSSVSNNLSYNILLRGFYWGTNVATPNYKSSGGGYGATVDVRFNGGQSANWGLGGEFVSIPNGPRLVNTGGAVTSSFNGVAGTAVGQNGVFGLEVPGTIQFGGGKIKYFLPTSSNLTAGVYGDYFSQTGARTAIGAGAEMGYKFSGNFGLDGYADVSNVTGNGFPAQTLVRYQIAGSYEIPNSSLQVFVGYRGMNYTAFDNTYISGVTAGLGTRF